MYRWIHQVSYIKLTVVQEDTTVQRSCLLYVVLWHVVVDSSIVYYTVLVKHVLLLLEAARNATVDEAPDGRRSGEDRCSASVRTLVFSLLYWWLIVASRSCF